jgi:CRISPR-associated protein Cas2
MIFGGMRSVWMIALFDLPTEDKIARKAYTDFRSLLLKKGFMMMQYSVYIRHCSSEANAARYAIHIKRALPDMGEIRLLIITDKQFGRMQVFHGKIPKDAEKAPEQIGFF